MVSGLTGSGLVLRYVAGTNVSSVSHDFLEWRLRVRPACRKRQCLFGHHRVAAGQSGADLHAEQRLRNVGRIRRHECARQLRPGHAVCLCGEQAVEQHIGLYHQFGRRSHTDCRLALRLDRQPTRRGVGGPGGNFLYVANSASNDLSIFSVNRAPASESPGDGAYRRRSLRHRRGSERQLFVCLQLFVERHFRLCHQRIERRTHRALRLPFPRRRRADLAQNRSGRPVSLRRQLWQRQCIGAAVRRCHRRTQRRRGLSLPRR